MSLYLNSLPTQSTLSLPKANQLSISIIQPNSRASQKKAKTVRSSSLQNKCLTQIIQRKEKNTGRNIRLVTRIAQIKQRTTLLKDNPSKCLHKHQNPEKKRLVELQNQRLGKSLMRIKLGKSLSRIRTEPSRQQPKKKKKHKLSISRLTEQYNLFRLDAEIQHYQGTHNRIVELASQKPPKLTPIKTDLQ